VSSRFVYFKSSETGRIDTPGFGGAAARNSRVMEAFAGVLVGPGRRYSAAEWAPINAMYTPPASAVSSDFEAEGYEARITANLTPNWRLVANYSYTDSGRTNLANEMVAWYGLKKGEGSPLLQGVTQNAAGQFVVNPSGYIGATSSGITVAEELFTMVSDLNDDKEQQEKRWGVRPHKISLFTAYDFKAGVLKNFTVGGGWRWRSANVIGTNASGSEITGKALTGTDLMLGYSRKFQRLPGRVRFQVNISNVFDKTDIIPTRLSTSAAAPNGYVVPGGRGVAYSRYDLVEPREVRFTTTYSF
jgi:hypothetical protein